MEKDDLEKVLEVAEREAPPMFHPVRERDMGAWYPSNEAARRASLISHTWEDICCLFQLRKKVRTDYEKKLLFKYAVIELTSLIDQIAKLQGIIFSVLNQSVEINAPSGYISQRDEETVRALFKEYHNVKARIERDLRNIRNRIGAHREDTPWYEIMKMWDKLDPDIFKDLFVVIPKLFGCIKDLDIYSWSREPEEGVIELCVSGLDRP